MELKEIIQRVIFAGHLNCWTDEEMAENILKMIRVHNYLIIKKEIITDTLKNTTELIDTLDKSLKFIGGINVQSKSMD